MAYNKYDSDKHPSYMDGIPVKISEQYKPPKKITLPGAILNKLNAESVLPEYDFTLERSVMDKMSQWRDLRRSQREERRQRAEQERKSRVAAEPTPAPEETSPPERTMSPPASEPYPILTPVPINASSNSQSTTYSKSFNISDFEQDTSSPFDNLELKTINDLEELAHVLRPTVLSDDEDKDKQMSPPTRLNGFNTPYGYNGSLNWTNNYNQFVGGYPNWYQSPNLAFPHVPGDKSAVPSYVVQRLDIGGQSSKSVPDIVQQLENELKDKREADNRRNLEQPQRPASIGPAELTRKSLPAEANRRPVSPKPVSMLPNPYAQLPLACQQLTNRLAEMGFPLPRVARATQQFGEDETRMVEFLVQVQRLEELGHPGDRAERALVANNYKETEAVHYLNTVAQLLDLGFPEDKIERVVQDCGSDRDKALDLLIS